MSELVYLQCVQEGRKLRIKIISPGFHNEANCSFPRDIRLPGRKYSVPLSCVNFVEGPNHKFFYRIRKYDIKIINETTNETTTTTTAKLDKVYEDTTIVDCIVCMSNEKNVVFAPCGHYALCTDCAIKIKNSSGKCPICRTTIMSIIDKNQIQY
jgi:hypothetical protein